ncbi:MAG: bifunctional [glutamate--ammonia ligase]-adenylyl-L-tyrosine phosphorylase/[glutamate--ammonia-ligase] adenylyltransferase [Nitrospina sp.]|jgi:[glutamine synthetase] adenylyltransferase / [glutamine synthetase]-adenylyl-L-tyrosine phosphorylase|nr:bifunctional [glutamate--ammonia ligase]-adenylyl-L-tyrosine phosphorylase/[glutamate--ammonia-ligase] adenylyltransferase [Nitrospina sp.]MBT3875277.1 bifunctional [glutamate--ammonia ligase]-adenylyl-L-tyrosine phosphorylase/[glutamate--ammonia-ligase] adenylyltransferase [Nitrospina sp.]MBT4048638.1 bifunctional [glutamate--ammonia ligase]-adenylyl-L-tyrosine phosphorylase/[glutamate--ammonia-ligase] adenylyltransferase [Nitrospina sp.]MBT4559066.1 bifunctional [glutamate--ammonia ligase]-
MTHNAELINKIHQRSPWDENLTEPLRGLGFREPESAWKNLIALAGHAQFEKLYPDFFHVLLELISSSHNADMALHNFERFSEKISDKDYLYTQLTESSSLFIALVFLFSGSQILTDTLLREPSYVDWLSRPETLTKSKTKDMLMRDFYEMAGEEFQGKNIFSALRKFKKREYIRIGLRDLLGKVDFKETVEDISNIADVCLQAAYEHSDRELRKKYGSPVYQDEDGIYKESEFAVLGMGKLGGLELNYSSDIDLIYIYTSSKGETRPVSEGDSSVISISNHEYFTKLALEITKSLNEITSDGNVFRVDLELRPEGKSGEIVNSLTSCEIYYQSWGRTWERQALIKARVSAGSENLGTEFFDMIEPFIYRRSLDFEAIEEIKSMKYLINKSLKGKHSKGNIKLGFGGIREVEFTIQAYQLLLGGRDKSLRVRDSLGAMKILCEKNILTEEDHHQLREAYIFLRNLENRVQITFGLQTYLLPNNETDLAILARKMRIAGDNQKNLAENLMQEYESHTQFVGKMFAEQFVEKEKREVAETISDGWSRSRIGEEQFTESSLAEIPFLPDFKRAYRFLESFRDGAQFSHPSVQSIQEFYSILPKIFQQCRIVPKPDLAIENLCKFVEATGARESFLKLFQANENFLELLLILFGSSGMLSQILIRRPDLVDVLTDMEAIYRYKQAEKIQEELNRAVKSSPDFESKSLVVRRIKQAEELRIGVRYLIKEADLAGTLEDLSNLADVFLETVYQIACDELGKKTGSLNLNNFCIIGMGKLGGHELNFGSDLDVLLVYDEGNNDSPSAGQYYSSLSQMIYKLTSEMTSAGYAYKIDTELRPEGDAGVLVLPIQGYEKYYKSRARIWEQQALVRARFVAGHAEVGKKFIEIAHQFVYQDKFEYESLIEISRLRERMELELAKETIKGKNVKLGFGGLADIEFGVQVLQLIHGKKFTRLRKTNTLSALQNFVALGLVDQDMATELQVSYLFLRNLECALRIIRQTPTNTLPKDNKELASLARLLGYKGEVTETLAGALLADYESYTQQVRKHYRKIIGNLLRAH